MDSKNKVIEKLGLPTEQELSDEQRARIVKEVISLFEREGLTIGQSQDLLYVTGEALNAHSRFVKLVVR